MNAALQHLAPPDTTGFGRWRFRLDRGAPATAVLKLVYLVRGHAEDLERQARAIIVHYSGGDAGLAPTDPNFMRCWRALDELLDAEGEYELPLIPVQELVIDAHTLSLPLLATLAPVLDDCEASP